MVSALFALLSTSAEAAQLADIQGTVLLNRGNGFERVLGSVPLQPGDRVMATGGGSARIVYSPACTTVVSSGTAVIIRSDPPCNGGTVLRSDGSALVIGGLVAGGVAAGVIALSGSGSSGPASP